MNKSDCKYLSRLTGKLLGDGCITKQLDRKPRFQFIHRVEDFGWSQYCYEQLKDYLPLNLPTYKRVNDPRLQTGYSECYTVQSKTSTIITELERLWYVNRKKLLPIAFINKYLNEEALAWWYQDDGHLAKKKNLPQKIILSTDSFSEKEHFSLQQMIQEKFCLSFKLDGQKRLILYDQPQIYYFLKLIEPYLQPCMNRKSISVEQSPQPTGSKRTTIYVPKQLQHPTMEINEQLVHAQKIFHQLEDRETFLSFYRSFNSLFFDKQNLKSYQIILNGETRTILQKIKKLSGWNQSQIAQLCFNKELTNLIKN